MHSDADRAKPPRPADSQYRMLAAKHQHNRISGTCQRHCKYSILLRYFTLGDCCNLMPHELFSSNAKLSR